jgi:hypothetical protein
VSELRVDLTAGHCVQMPSFGNHCFGDPLTQYPDSELVIGVGQFKPQCPRRIEPPGRCHGRDAAGKSDLFGNAAADHAGMRVGGELFGDLGLGEPHRFGGLQRRRHRPQFLQPGDPINSSRIRDRTIIGRGVGEFGQHLIQPRDQPVRGRRLGMGC